MATEADTAAAKNSPGMEDEGAGVSASTPLAIGMEGVSGFSQSWHCMMIGQEVLAYSLPW